jgi:uncharacterized RDD family membrane protein YckC
MGTSALAAARLGGHDAVATDHHQEPAMPPTSLRGRLPWTLFAGAGTAAGLGLYTHVAASRTNTESALVLSAVGTLLLLVALLLAAVGLALRVHGRRALVRRAAARLVDLGLAAVVALLIGLGVAPLLAVDPGDHSETRLVVFLFGVPLLAAVQETVLVASIGQTVGKLLAGVRIQRLDGTPPGWKTSALRAAPLLLVISPVVGGQLLLLLVYLWTVGARDQRGLHDRLAGTRVVPA